MTKLKLYQLAETILNWVDNYWVDNYQELRFDIACYINTQCNLGLDMPEDYIEGWENK